VGSIVVLMGLPLSMEQGLRIAQLISVLDTSEFNTLVAIVIIYIVLSALSKIHFYSI